MKNPLTMIPLNSKTLKRIASLDKSSKKSNKKNLTMNEQDMLTAIWALYKSSKNANYRKLANAYIENMKILELGNTNNLLKAKKGLVNKNLI